MNLSKTWKQSITFTLITIFAGLSAHGQEVQTENFEPVPGEIFVEASKYTSKGDYLINDIVKTWDDSELPELASAQELLVNEKKVEPATPNQSACQIFISADKQNGRFMEFVLTNDKYIPLTRFYLSQAHQYQVTKLMTTNKDDVILARMFTIHTENKKYSLTFNDLGKGGLFYTFKTMDGDFKCKSFK